MNAQVFMAAHSSPTQTDDMFLDSGATITICRNITLLHSYQTVSTPESITTANNGKVTIHGYGSLKFKTSHGNAIMIPRVAYVPDISCNLLNSSALLADDREYYWCSLNEVAH